MTIFDYLFAAILIISAVFGAKRGIVSAALGFAAWVIGAFAAYHYCEWFAARLPFKLPWEPLSRWVLSFVIIFALTLLCVSLLSWLIKAVLKSIGLGIIDSFVGLLFGILRGGVMILITVTLLSLTSITKEEAWQNAASRPILENLVLYSKAWLPTEFGNWLRI